MKPWWDDAACRQLPKELFYGPDGEREPQRSQRISKAKQVCMTCTVRTDCHQASLEHDETGVWAGQVRMSVFDKAKHRRHLRRTGQTA